MTSANGSVSEKNLDATIATLLRIGVTVAAFTVFAGGALYLAYNASSLSDYRSFHGESSDLRHVAGILRGAMAFRPEAIIQLGLLLLIATPVARVAFTVFAFAYERDWIYVFVTLVVLALLIYSLGPWHL